MGHFLKKARHAIYRFGSGYYNVLLTLLVLLFVFRPYEHRDLYVGVWKIFFSAALMMAIFNVHHKKSFKIAASILAVPAVMFTWVSLFTQGESVIVGVTISNVLFMAVCTSSILRDVIVRARVTLETLRGVICAYFLVAAIFTYLYVLIETVHPGSISVDDKILDIQANPQYFFSLMAYFSFTTLLTIGYGDILAVRDLSQTACILEGIIGQFYIAILVSRLVSVYSFYSNKELLKTLEHDIFKETPHKE